ncbi:hypothetical protein [Teichococcus wenyumeiae]|nr:hypothetical protein [Pseudoroseomonas wenyumeiae]
MAKPELLNRDFRFPLPDAGEITMLAEGGYALCEGDGCRAILPRRLKG